MVGPSMKIRIVTDSTSDLPADIVTSLGITVVPAYINVGDESFRDGVEMSREAFYRQLPSFSSHPTTAAPAAGTFAEAY
jgi:fatty acid-binding protein DegV